jgi:hypothetical protein
MGQKRAQRSAGGRVSLSIGEKPPAAPSVFWIKTEKGTASEKEKEGNKDARYERRRKVFG